MLQIELTRRKQDALETLWIVSKCYQFLHKKYTIYLNPPDYDDVTGDLSKQVHMNDYWYNDVAQLLGSLMPSREEYISIYGRLLVNSFALRADTNGEEENIGTALYRANSIFDHSCAPNATTVFQGNQQNYMCITSSYLSIFQGRNYSLKP